MDEHDRRQRPKQWANRRSFLPRSCCLSASGCQHAVFIRVPIFQCAREKNCNAEISYQYVIMMKMARSDPSLDTLLELDGQVLVIDEAGYWVKFVVHRVPSTADKPHGLDYTLTLHGPDGGRLVGFDNAHGVAGQGKRTTKDHSHRLRTVKPYDYTDAATLVAAFWSEVESVLRERGVWT